VTSFVLDGEQSRVRLHTFAEGMFARLAHDLELVCRGISGTAETTSEGAGTATLEVPIGQIDVGGTLKGGRVDPGGLSNRDRQDCLDKMRQDVFRLKGPDRSIVRVEAMIASASPNARAEVRVRIAPPHGPAIERTVHVRIDGGAPEATAPRVSGSFELSISSLGGGTVKGPMNAFRVKDNVGVYFDLAFKPA
jgi:hypothetical protein